MRGQILVTGGSGLLGEAVRKIHPQARFVSSRDFDLRDICQVENLFHQTKPEKVIHLAACVAGVKSNALKNADLFTDNILINTNVLNIAQKSGVKRLISVLSSCCYPFFDDRASTENDLHTGLPFKGNLGYGMSKRMLDLQTHLLNEQYGCPFSSITPMTMYGPHDNWDLEEGHVIGSLIHKCFLAKQNSKPLEVWGSGKAVRQFIYAQDVAQILLQMLESFEGPDTVIVAANNGVSIKELALLIAKIMDFKGQIIFDATKPEGQVKRVLESSKNNPFIKSFSFTSLEKGLHETVSWFEAHADSFLEVQVTEQRKAV